MDGARPRACFGSRRALRRRCRGAIIDREKTARVVREICGHDATISCRFTHIYPDGPAPYFSYSALGTSDGKLSDSLAKWREIKHATNEIVVGLGGTVTH